MTPSRLIDSPRFVRWALRWIPLPIALAGLAGRCALAHLVVDGAAPVRRLRTTRWAFWPGRARVLVWHQRKRLRPHRPAGPWPCYWRGAAHHSVARCCRIWWVALLGIAEPGRWPAGLLARFGGQRASVGLALALPLLASLQFYARIPAAGALAGDQPLAAGNGAQRGRSGSSLVVDGQLILVDAPARACRWCGWAASRPAPWHWPRGQRRQLSAAPQRVGVLVLTGNVARNASRCGRRRWLAVGGVCPRWCG